MLALDSRAARVAWTVALVVLLLGAFYTIRHTLMVFVLAILLAYLLAPMVNIVDRFSSSRLPRTLSMGVVYVVLLGAVGAVFAAIGGRVADEAAQLASLIPTYVKEPQRLEQLPLPWWLRTYQRELMDFVIEQIQAHQDQIVPMLTSAGKGVLSAVGSAVILVIVPILSFFFLKDAAEIRNVIVAQFPGGRQRIVNELLGDVHFLMGRFVRAMVLLALSTFAIFSIALGAFDVRFALLLSAFAGAGEFVPIAGPVASGAAILLVATLSGSGNVAALLVFLIVYRLFLDYVLQPYLMGHGVELPPLAIVFGILAGEELGGVLGMFLSIPVLAILRILYVHYRKHQSVAG